MMSSSKIMVLVLFASLLSAHRIDFDDRQYLNRSNERTFSGVGKVVCQDSDSPNKKLSVTGTLIGNAETVITVGHYRTAPTGHVFKVQGCQYLNYDEDGKLRFSAAIREERIARPQADYLPYNTAVPDWALLRLDKTVNAQLAQPLNYRILSFDLLQKMDGSVLVAHHSHGSGAVSNRRIASPNCRIEQRGDRTRYFAHYCDTSLGSSGGLFFQLAEDGSIYAFALNTAESNPQSGPIVNFGQPLTNEHDKLIQDLDW